MYDDKLCFSRQKSLCRDIVTGLPTLLYFCYVYLKTFYMQCECEIPGEHFTEIVPAKKKKNCRCNLRKLLLRIHMHGKMHILHVCTVVILRKNIQNKNILTLGHLFLIAKLLKSQDY